MPTRREGNNPTPLGIVHRASLKVPRDYGLTRVERRVQWKAIGRGRPRPFGDALEKERGDIGVWWDARGLVTPWRSKPKVMGDHKPGQRGVRQVRYMGTLHDLGPAGTTMPSRAKPPCIMLYPRILDRLLSAQALFWNWKLYPTSESTYINLNQTYIWQINDFDWLDFDEIQIKCAGNGNILETFQKQVGEGTYINLNHTYIWQINDK